MCSERETEQASEREGDSQTCIVSDYAKVEHERALSVFLESGAPAAQRRVLLCYFGDSAPLCRVLVEHLGPSDG